MWRGGQATIRVSKEGDESLIRVYVTDDTIHTEEEGGKGVWGG